MPESIPAPLIIDTLKDTFREARAALAAEGVRPRHDHLGWILSVPDTHQKTVLAALDKERALRVLTCSTEDEAHAVAAGLWMGGEPFVLMIQHAGLYASVNTLRGVAMDGRVPTMTTAPAWRTIAPNDLSVGCVGFMGGASSLGLGLALARPDRRVLVFDGDGSLLMQLGSLATVAGAAPRNLVHFLFKNGVYHTSGAQEIPGGGGVDFVLMAKGAGYRAAYAIGELSELERRLPSLLSAEGPILVELHTGLADKTPMTAGMGTPFPPHVERLRGRLIAS